jgi:hypothetical protein
MNCKPGTAYTVAFETTSLTTADANIFPFQAGEDTRVMVESIHVGIKTTDAENVGILIYRGSTTPLSTAAYVTPVAIRGHSGANAADSLCNSPSSGSYSTASAALVDARTMEGGYSYEYEDWGMELVPEQRMDVILRARSIATVYGTLRFREIGKNPID